MDGSSPKKDFVWITNPAACNHTASLSSLCPSLKYSSAKMSTKRIKSSYVSYDEIHQAGELILILVLSPSILFIHLWPDRYSPDSFNSGMMSQGFSEISRCIARHTLCMCPGHYSLKYTITIVSHATYLKAGIVRTNYNIRE